MPRFTIRFEMSDAGERSGGSGFVDQPANLDSGGGGRWCAGGGEEQTDGQGEHIGIKLT